MECLHSLAVLMAAYRCADAKGPRCDTLVTRGTQGAPLPRGEKGLPGKADEAENNSSLQQ
ncbi:hypothetical protein M419DRAFT_124143 [Trichoderma reesei RUT C-30]|uniref:Uncharacterized protein n=1 Tax=Hypocrea jecorina (strain ATCC 56765 / BCRC 32924 / NRRL 11460 / Rut C-30) TaxID=1344414 RepID=A0A024S7P7_HYPJR|nr:hypothetical protein M419DRAFT_124143 [Trichoderma reesei RUT C-30]